MRATKRRIAKRRFQATALVLAAAIGLTGVETVLASTIDKANEKKNEAQNELDSTKQDINRIEDEQSQLQQEIDALDTELVNVIMNLSILESDLAAKGEQLVQVQADLEQAQADEDKQYEAMKKRIRFMYERGDSAMLTSILESRSITDLLNRVEYVNEVYDYDRKLLEDYQETKLQVADLKLRVQGEIAELEEMQANYQDEQTRYETLIAKKQGEMSDFAVQLANARQLAARYQATIDEQNEIIRQEEERIRKEEEERKRREEEERRAEERRAQAAVIAAANRNNAISAASGSGNSGSASSSSGSAGSGSGGSSAGSTGSGSGSSSSKSGSSGGSESSGGNLNPGFSTGVSGGSVVDYACGFIGNPYVWGGTDPNTGADCSGFTQYVYRKFGVSLPRSSYEQCNAGKAVSYANAQPGDLICYSGHVAIYMGGGQIVHASNPAAYPAGGIKTGSATYRTIISVRRVL